MLLDLFFRFWYFFVTFFLVDLFRINGIPMVFRWSSFFSLQVVGTNTLSLSLIEDSLLQECQSLNPERKSFNCSLCPGGNF